MDKISSLLLDTLCQFGRLGLESNPANITATIQTAKTSESGVRFLTRHEGLRLHMYNDPAGHATIGYGHLIHKGKINGSESEDFKNGLTKDQAMDLLKTDLKKFEKVVEDSVKVPLTQNQFDALVSFTYNVGPANFKSSTLLKKINAGDFEGAKHEFPKWKFADGQVLPGLIHRRAAEAKLFADGLYVD